MSATAARLRRSSVRPATSYPGTKRCRPTPRRHVHKARRHPRHDEHRIERGIADVSPVDAEHHPATGRTARRDRIYPELEMKLVGGAVDAPEWHSTSSGCDGRASSVIAIPTPEPISCRSSELRTPICGRHDERPIDHSRDGPQRDRDRRRLGGRGGLESRTGRRRLLCHRRSEWLPYRRTRRGTRFRPFRC